MKPKTRIRKKSKVSDRVPPQRALATAQRLAARDWIACKVFSRPPKWLRAGYGIPSLKKQGASCWIVACHLQGVPLATGGVMRVFFVSRKSGRVLWTGEVRGGVSGALLVVKQAPWGKDEGGRMKGQDRSEKESVRGA